MCTIYRRWKLANRSRGTRARFYFLSFQKLSKSKISAAATQLGPLLCAQYIDCDSWQTGWGVLEHVSILNCRKNMPFTDRHSFSGDNRRSCAISIELPVCPFVPPSPPQNVSTTMIFHTNLWTHSGLYHVAVSQIY